jgi:hypothetical protein
MTADDPASIVVEKSIETAETLWEGGLIDNLSNIEDHPVFISKMMLDMVVPNPMQDAEELFYEEYLANIFVNE